MIFSIFFGHDTDLVFGQVRLELFGLLNSAQADRHAGILVKFLCQTCLHRGRGKTLFKRSHAGPVNYTLISTRGVWIT